MANKRRERGSAAIEFALCFVLMFSLFCAVMEFSRIVYARTVLAGATREASRYAMVHGSRSGSPASDATIRAKVVRWASTLNSDALVVNTTWIPSNTPGSRVRVQASYTIAPLARFVISTPLTIGSRSEMVISQ